MIPLVLTLIGDDRPGLVSAVAGAVEARGGSWRRSQLARLGGKFAGIVLVDVPEGALTGLEQDLAALHAQGLQVAVARADGPAAEEPTTDGPRWSLHLVGQDRPGIVAEISGVLARHGVGIDELQTDVLDAPMAGGTLFEASAQLSLAPGADADQVRHELEQLAAELMVDLDVHPGDG